MLSEYNLLLRAHSNFFVPWPDRRLHRFNTTFTQPPIIDAQQQTIFFAIDGTIYDNHLGTNHVERTKAVATRNVNFTGNQLFVHQTALASLLYAINTKILPYFVNDSSTSLEIVGEFPEIKKHYDGHGTEVDLSVMITPSSGNFLSLSSKDGFVLGKGSDLYVSLSLYCSNPSMNRTRELCLIFDIKTSFNMNVTVEDFNLYLAIGDATIDSVQVTKDIIGMKNRDYQRVLQHILNYAIANFNYMQSLTPIDLKPASNWIPLFREIVYLTATPYIQDEFLFIGFDAKSKPRDDPTK